MNYTDVFYLSHVTDNENVDPIREEGFILQKALHSRFSGALSRTGAPRVVFFCASYYGGDLPNRTPFPNNLCYPADGQECPRKNKFVSRILIDSSLITTQGEYRVFKVCSENLTKYDRHVFYFVRADDTLNLEWCYANNLNEYNLFAGPGKDRPIYVENDRLRTRDMLDRKIVNIVFSEDFRDCPFDMDYVRHQC